MYTIPNDLQYFGFFGNADPTKKNDWVQVLQNYTFTAGSSYVNNICNFPSNIIMDVMFSRGGITANPQKYIISSRISAVNFNYTYQSSIDIKFIVNFIDLDIKQYNSPLPTPSILPRLPSDIANPFVKG